VDWLIAQGLTFTDESWFEQTDDGTWVWRRRGEDEPSIYKMKAKAVNRVLVLGGFGYNFKSELILIIGTETASKYRQILEESNILGPDDVMFQQDGARPHVAFKTIQYLAERRRILPEWPSNSPDLNKIEPNWSWM
jgi:hypothetical protein